MAKVVNPLPVVTHRVSLLEDFIVTVYNDEQVGDATTLAARDLARDRLIYGRIHDGVPSAADPPDATISAEYVCSVATPGAVPPTLVVGDVHCVWYSRPSGAGSDPEDPGRVSIEVPLVAGLLNGGEIAAATALVLDAQPYFNASSNGTTLSVDGVEAIGDAVM